MCSKGGGSPPVPSAASTTFNSTTAPSAFATPLYQDFLNRANTLSNTPFNPAQLGTVAPLNAQQTAAGNQLFNLGMTAGQFDPAQVHSIESPYTEDVVNATQNWFNNQNAIQGNDLLSQAIRSGNAFGGDRAGVGESILAGQQQLAQAPVIAGLRQAGYTQALDEYNKLKTMGLQGAGAALGWGSLEQAQAQKEADVAQQNAMMQSAYPFQTLNWYGSLLGGIAPLLGQTAFGSNNPPAGNSTAAAIGAGAAGLGLASSLIGGGGSSSSGTGPTGFGSRGGVVGRFRRGGLVPVFVRHNGGIVAGLAYGGDTGGDDDDQRDQSTRYSSPDIYRSSSEGGAETASPPSREDATSSRYYTPPPRKATRSDLGLDPVTIRGQAPSFPVQTGSSGTTQPQNTLGSTLSGIGSLVSAGAKLAPLLALAKHGGTIRRYDDGGRVRLAGDIVPLPIQPGPMAGHPTASESIEGRFGQALPRLTFPSDLRLQRIEEQRARWPGPRGRADGGGTDDDDQLTMTDLGVLDPQGRPLSPGIAGQSRGSPGANEAGLRPVSGTDRFSPVQQAEDMPNLARVRERFKPALEGNEALRRKFDINTTAEVGTDQARRDAYQASVLDRAAARGESLPYTLSRGPGTPDRYYPGTTANARAASGQGVSPSLWGGANPANFGTGNASRDPRTGRDVGFGGGPQTGSAGAERFGIEGTDLAAAERFGYRGPRTTAIGFGAGAPQGTYGGDATARQMAQTQYPEGTREKVGVSPDEEQRRRGAAGPPEAGTGAVGTKIPGIPEKTFAQRLAGNPFWQFGTALMAKPGIRSDAGFLSALGGAAQSMSGQQLAQRKEDILENKPEMIHTDKGIAFRYPNGQVVQTGLKSEAAGEHEAQRRFEAGKPFTVKTTEGTGLFTEPVERAYIRDSQGNVVPFGSPAQAAPSSQQNVIPRQPQQQPPPAPPAQQQPAPQVRQSETQQPAPAAQAESGPAPDKWQKMPDGNVRGPDGTIYDGPSYEQGTKKVITPAPTQTAQQQQPPAKEGVAGPEETLAKVQKHWETGTIKPPGAITDPDALAANRNEAVLENATPEQRKYIQDVVDGRINLKDIPIKKREQVQRIAAAYDNDWTPQKAANRNVATKAFGINGVEARNIQSQDMAVQHAASAMKNIDQLNHSGRPWWNEFRASPAVKNILGSADNEYQRALGRTKQDLTAVSNELMKVYRGGTGQPSEREAKRIADTLKVTDNPEVLKDSLREGVDLLYGRIYATAFRYNDAVGPGYQRPPESWMSPEGRAAIQRIRQGQ